MNLLELFLFSCFAVAMAEAAQPSGERFLLMRSLLKWFMPKPKKSFLDKITEMTEKQLRAISEKSFKAWVMERAKEEGWKRCHFLPTQIRPGRWVTAYEGESGIPDVILAREGRLLIWELKKQDGVASEEQLEWIRLLASAGVETGVYRPSDSFKLARMLGEK